MRSASPAAAITNLSDPILQQASFQVNSNSFTPYPTGARRLQPDEEPPPDRARSRYNKLNSTPDTTNNREPFFPGFPNTGSQQSTRYSTSQYLRSTFGREHRQHVPRRRVAAARRYFSPELSPSLFGGNSIGDQGGYFLNIGNGCCATALANAGGSGAFQAREASTRVFENDLNWLKGKHNLSVRRLDDAGPAVAAEPDDGAGDALRHRRPAIRRQACSRPPTSPGASTAQLNNARALYALLTGRVSQILGNARLNEDTNQYQYLGNGFQRGHDAAVGLLRAGQLARAQQPDHQRRPALRAAAAVRRRRTTATRRRRWPTSAASPASAPTASATCSSPAR